MTFRAFPFVCNARQARRLAFAGWGATALLLGGCDPAVESPPIPSVEWNQQKFGPAPERRPLSTLDVTADHNWVVAREKVPAAATLKLPVARTVHLGIGGMDCGDCQHLVANELGRLSGVRQARVSQAPPETVVEYDPGKLTDRQIEGAISSLGLQPKLFP